MTERSIKLVGESERQPKSGVLRPFPTKSIPDLDPFVFLDTAAPQALGNKDIFVGPHPHHGVQPVSLLFRGEVWHRDSLGHTRTVKSGGMQWLVAGSGALHEEVLKGDEAGIFHMAQLWINVPDALKMEAPEHHALGAEAIPELGTLGPGSLVRLYAGQ